MEDGGRGWSDGSAPREHLGLLAVSAEARKEAGNKKKKKKKRQGTHSPAESSEGTNPLTALFLLSWGIVALPYCVSFCCTRK